METIDFKNLFLQGQPIMAVLQDLLIDRTTDKNILWATSSYEDHGEDYSPASHLQPEQILNLISEGKLLPRVLKTKEQQQKRTKAKAEVFTPSWVCNIMNNHVDEEWYGRKDVFNTTSDDDHKWQATEGRILFPDGKTWKDYVDANVLEITCGEAPFLISRYDTTTGEDIEITDRIGMLDRKLRIVNENAETEEDWLKWTYRAYKAAYGYEYQGDNLFLARINMVQTFMDYYADKFHKAPSIDMIRDIADIVSWNIWQMDGLKDTIPITGEASLIMDWHANRALEFRSIKDNTGS